MWFPAVQFDGERVVFDGGQMLEQATQGHGRRSEPCL
jgi:hypothetical protein